MCLVVVAFQRSRRWPLLVAANRDEFHARASAPLAAWQDFPEIAGGRDLQAGGTWMAATLGGRFSAVTNVRLGLKPLARPRTRGHLPMAGLAAPARNLGSKAIELELGDVEQYGPFGLLVGDRESLHHHSNVFPSLGALTPGIHVLSNGPMNAPWPKAEQVRATLGAAIQSADPTDKQLYEMMAISTYDQSQLLPDTGVGIDLESRLAPVFIADRTYGTRATTLLRIGANDQVQMSERRFSNEGAVIGERKLYTDGGSWQLQTVSETGRSSHAG